MPLNTAQKTALQLLDRLVDLQATVLSYMDVFLWVGVMFLIGVPFVILFIKKSTHRVDMEHLVQE